MEEQNEMNQEMNDGQHLQELRERITAKAEDLIKWQATERKKNRGTVIAIWVVLAAIFVAIEVYSYVNGDFWGSNAWLLAFLVSYLIVDRIMVMIMRRYLSRMKNAGTNRQYFREVKRLIRTHKLRLWVPLAVAFTCTYTVMNGIFHDWPLGYLSGSALVFGSILGGLLSNWRLDDDFRYDIEELVNLINHESDT